MGKYHIVIRNLMIYFAYAFSIVVLMDIGCLL